MKNELWYDIFMGFLHKKYPRKNQLTAALMDLLSIEREAVYRRLRGDVKFHAEEVVKIASTWHFSIDELISLNEGMIPFQGIMTNYLNPSEEDMEILHNRLKALEHLKYAQDSEYMVVSNNVSRSLACGFEYIYRFNIFKWAYLYSKDANNISFAEAVLPEEVCTEFRKFNKIMKFVQNTSYIFEQNIFENFVRDIQFFHSILLITDKEKKLIKKDLLALIDYLLDVATTGVFPETKNKVQIYISMININTNYSYFYTDKLKTCRVHAFNMHDICTYHPQTLEQFRNWMQLKKRVSILISETDAKSRVEFFSKQRQFAESL